MHKTNAARILDKQGISYELKEYEVDEDDLSATSAAAKIGEGVNLVFKTLVLLGDKTGIIVAVIPGGAELNLKALAKVSNNKSVAMVHMKELLGITGYIRGGCSPIGMKKNYPTFIHESCRQYNFIYVSAGMRGLQLKIHPDDLVKSCRGMVCSIIL
ncbi:MAG: Cys-tRNA(Pro) deacylase [Lentimicrobiaceae bacterium]|jgi:Cys-tRNA(Pro)/Cys-tRNA(Cys) deacylase|nr:Cys-tRNA(Pro) deacylase [Lentimicrobiaceae bacterium]